MVNTVAIFEPSRAAALARLQEFAPNAGQDYGAGRNYYGSARAPGAVSALSPYLRTGIISQSEVLRTVLDHHSAKAADRFITEVLWRSYWQGWLALRPTVWDSYQSDLKRLFNDIQTQSGLRDRWQSACLGQTGIAPFDAWASELVETGYLHNHARMWFASIWIHSLKLPWQLGADFFLRHLLDGCPASNTLGWKWVAGIQTIGKPYLATQENIAKFANNTYRQVSGLAQTPADIPALPHPDRQPLWPTGMPDPSLKSGFLLHPDDLNPTHALGSCPAFVGHLTIDATASQTPLQMAAQTESFRAAAFADTQTRLEGQIGSPAPTVTDASAIADWARKHGIKQIVTADAPIGPTKTLLDTYDQAADGPPLVRVRAPLNADAWPLATAGFFKFRKHIPNLLKGLG